MERRSGAIAGEDEEGEDPSETVAQLRRRLGEEAELRRVRDRELAELSARAQDAEAQVATIRLTLAYGLGQALVDARNWAGLKRLPRRLIELRRTQRAKRGWKTAPADAPRAAEQMQFVDEAMRIDRAEGPEAARRWIATLPTAQRAARARALAEIGLAHVGDPDEALACAIAAIALCPGEARLAALAAALHEAGHVATPRRIFAGMGGAQALGEAQRRRIALLDQEAEALAGGVPVAPRASREPGAQGVAVCAARAMPWRQDAAARRAEAVVRAIEGSALVIGGGGDGGLASGGEATGRLRIGGADEEAMLVALRAGHIGLVHLVCGDAGFDRAALAAARRAGAAVVLDLATCDPRAMEENERGEAARSRLRALIEGADRVVVRNGAIGEIVGGLAPSAELVVLDDALVAPDEWPDEGALAGLRREYGLGPAGRVIACFSAFDGIDPGAAELIAAFERVQLRHPDAAVLLCGSGPGVAALMRAAARAGIAAHVVRTGTLPAHRIPALVALAALVVVPDRAAGAILADVSGAIALARTIGTPLLASAQAWEWAGQPGGAPPVPGVVALEAALGDPARPAGVPVDVTREIRALHAALLG